MTNNILVFRTDRIGDLLITCPAIVTIKKHFPNSSITMIASRKNYDYAKGLKIFEDVICLFLMATQRGSNLFQQPIQN